MLKDVGCVSSAAVAVVAALVEGNSIRATARMTDVSKPTILKLLADLGMACAAFHNERVRNIRSQRIQGTLKVTPAMAAGLSDHVWSLEEIVELLDRSNAAAA